MIRTTLLYSSLLNRCHRFSRTTRTTKRNLRVVIFGPPGGGKGTQSEKLKNDYQLLPISSGHLLRTAVKNKSQVGMEAAPLLEEGKLVGDELMINVIKDVFRRDTQMAEDNWILDGFPRTLEQAEAIDAFLGEIGSPIDAALFLEVPEDVILERLGDRRVHESSGRTYHLTYNPPKEEGKDDVTGEPLVTRDDDKPDQIKHRLEIYTEQTKPLYEFYQQKGLLHNIPSPNSDIGYKHIQSIIDSLKQKSLRN